MLNLYNYTLSELTKQLKKWGWSAYYAGILWQNLYHNHHITFDSMTNLPTALANTLHQHAILNLPIQHLAIDSNDKQTRKFLLTLADNQLIETVQMQYRDRYTVCISSQVGCAMSCVFCATGQMGFHRHLTAGEIVGQVLFVQQALGSESNKLRNIVLMGMGEPLHNYEATMTAIHILTDHKGLAIAPRHITLSTVGLPNQIRHLADDDCPVNLAVSLHAATDTERVALVPPAKKWSLADVIAACHYYSEKRGKRIFFEWALIAGKNDTSEQAHAVGQLLQGLDAHLNVIPLNPTQGYSGQPSHASNVQQFQQIVSSYGIPSTVRQRRGIDIAAGCGQLRASVS